MAVCVLSKKQLINREQKYFLKNILNSRFLEENISGAYQQTVHHWVAAYWPDTRAHLQDLTVICWSTTVIYNKFNRI